MVREPLGERLPISSQPAHVFSEIDVFSGDRKMLRKEI